MTTATLPRPTTSAPSHDPRFADLLRSEWTKIRTLRSTTWSLLTMVIVALGLNIAATSVYTAKFATLDAATQAQFKDNTIGLILQPGAQFGQVAVCVLGVLLMASEYSTGMIRASMLAAPRRTPVLAAKAAAFGALVFILAELVALPSFFIGSAITSKHASTSITDLSTIRAVLAFGVFMALMGLISLAIGTLVRHPAAGISIVLALQFVVPGLISLIPGMLGKHLADAFPSNTDVIMGTGPTEVGSLTPLQGFCCLLGWAVVLLGAAWVSIKRRDV
ncbi:MAG TPA: ABC transporter permease [Actinocrinis sp.]|nr:ABC transporter permease [Actinocrinis sp.]